MHAKSSPCAKSVEDHLYGLVGLRMKPKFEIKCFTCVGNVCVCLYEKDKLLVRVYTNKNGEKICAKLL